MGVWRTHVIVVDPPKLPVALKVIGLPAKDPDAVVTVFVPALEPKVNILDASPKLLVDTFVALRDPPPAVTANVTATPETGLPAASVAFTVNGLARG